MNNNTTIFYPKTIEDWYGWLKNNHHSQSAVWVVFHTKASGRKTITWSDAVDAALCYGWIDSKKIKIDAETSHQFFSKRKPKSTWSKINKDKVGRLIEKGLMTFAGLAAVEIAKENGSWTILDGVEELVIPEDLEQEWNTRPEAKEFFFNLSKSTRKAMLQWLALAKRPETRKNRIDELITLAVQKMKPKQF